MKRVFVDTQYWVAIARPRDSWAIAAHAARRRIAGAILVTTDEVLTEFATLMSRGGPAVRETAADVIRTLLADPEVDVVPQTRAGFERGLTRYMQRLDKSYSLVDCISMNVMEAEGIQEVLTNDRHFLQEGFTVLIQ